MPLKLGFVRHDADFAVDEKGTVAAAATVSGLEEVSAKKQPRGAMPFDADRPFLFFLRDDRTGAILFAGRLAEPAIA